MMIDLGTTTPRSDLKARPMSTSVRDVKTDESLPFPSVRKTNGRRPFGSPEKGEAVRRPRASLPGGGGASAAALAARAKVGIVAPPPVPPVPTDTTAELTLVAPVTTETIITTPEATITSDHQPILEPEITPDPLQNGVTAETVDAFVVSLPPTDPLTAEALNDHDTKEEDENNNDEGKGTQLDEAVSILELSGHSAVLPSRPDMEHTESKVVGVLSGESHKLEDDNQAASLHPIKVEMEGVDHMTGDDSELAGAGAGTGTGIGTVSGDRLLSGASSPIIPATDI